MIEETYIRTADPAIQEVMYDTLYNLSFMVEDVSGKIRDREARVILTYLKVNSLGDIQDLGGDLVLPQDTILGKETFTPKLSSYAMELYTHLQTLSGTVVHKEDYTGELEPNYIFEHALEAPTPAQAYASYLYLETFTILSALVQYRSADTLKITLPEIDTMLSNCRYVMGKIGTLGNDVSVYQLLNVVKRIQSSIFFVKEGILSIQG